MARTTSALAALLVAALSLLGAATVHAQSPGTVRVDGTGNVGIGNNTGTININGPTRAELDAAFKASGAEQKKLLQDIAAKLNTALAKLNAPAPLPPAGAPARPAPADEFNATIVHGFLATVVGKKVPEGDWPRTFNELAGRFLETGNRIAATPVTSDDIKALVARAETARKAGDLDTADRLLEQAEEQAIADAAQKKDEARASARQAASLLATRASIAFTRLEREQGARLLERAFEQRTDDVDSDAYWWLIEAADAWTTQGSSRAALKALIRARSIATTQLERAPDSTLWQRNLSVSHNKIGDTQTAQGDLAGALSSFQAGMAIRQKLATSDPGNAQWQRDLSVSHNKIGDTQTAQGDLAGALRSFQAQRAIAQKLAASDPGNAERQRDLGVSHNWIGNTQTAQGDLAGALQSFQASMAIAQKLAASDPGNAQWQRDLSVSHIKIGETQTAQGDLAGALRSFQADMAIAQKLAASDPGNAEWQRDLSVSHNKIGDTQTAQGDLVGALRSFQAGMAIAQKLAASDPGNAQWQRDLSISHDRIGDTQTAQGDLAGALRSFQAGMAIRQKLAASDPGNAEWQRDLIVSHFKLNRVTGDKAHLQKALDVALAMQAKGILAPRDTRMIDALKQLLAQ